MICAIYQPTKQTVPTRRQATSRAAAAPRTNRQTNHPLLDWIADELRKEDNLNNRQAMGQARRILEQAFAAVTTEP